MVELGSANQQIRWAASHTDALIPRPHWGGGESGGLLVRVLENQPLSPLPETWRRLDPAEIRQPVPGVIALTLTRELDGSSADFGRRAWTLLEQRIPALAERLHRNAPLQTMHYTDRYLRSPLTLLLLHELLNGLPAIPAACNKSLILKSKLPNWIRRTQNYRVGYSTTGAMVKIVGKWLKHGLQKPGRVFHGVKRRLAICPMPVN